MVYPDSTLLLELSEAVLPQVHFVGNSYDEVRHVVGDQVHSVAEDQVRFVLAELQDPHLR